MIPANPPPVHTHSYVVVMAGGGGTRLWPQSRRRRPKQFLPLLPGGETLLGATIRRTLPLCPIERTLVVTAASQAGLVRQAVPALPEANVVIEPVGRNTAPCIALAALVASQRDPDAVLAVLPSDHYVRDPAAFAQVLGEALRLAGHGHVVTIGIRPDRPETGYGYIEMGDTSEMGDGAHLVAAFVEKPDAERAAAYLRAGTYLWNSGMFFFPARRILQEIREQLPPLAEILDEVRRDPEKLSLRYPAAPAISIDYAVMEKLGQRRAGRERALRVLPGDFGWNDVGSFAALAELSPADADGNHWLPGKGGDGEGPAPLLLRARGNIVWGGTRQLIAAVGIEGLVITVTEDAVLIVPRERAQEVKDVVEALGQGGKTGLL